MCTEETPDAIRVCDVAIRDVRAALAGDSAVTFEHVPFEGTRVINVDHAHTADFRRRVASALAPHGGGLRDVPPASPDTSRASK